MQQLTTVRAMTTVLCLSAGMASGASPVHADSAAVLAATSAADWRTLDPESTLVMTLPAGRVVIELAPRFAPQHVANVRTLVHEGYFDGLAVVRSQDNYVAQWGDPDAETPEKARSFGTARHQLAAEFDRPLAGLKLQRLPDRDGWAPVTGFVDGLPVAANPSTGRAWLAHCYGMVGAGRDTPPDSSNGAELYAVNGQSPRALDLNVTLVGRVVRGMEWLSSLPRGTGPLGFYTESVQRTPITSVQLVADMPIADRPAIEVLRTNTPAWTRWLDTRRNRREAWFARPAGHVDLCNVTVPTRDRPN